MAVARTSVIVAHGEHLFNLPSRRVGAAWNCPDRAEGRTRITPSRTARPHHVPLKATYRLMGLS